MIERFELAAERVEMCLQEQFPNPEFDCYFKEAAGFLKMMCQQYDKVAKAGHCDTDYIGSRSCEHICRASRSQKREGRVKTAGNTNNAFGCVCCFNSLAKRRRLN